jgi:uncharacterized protein
MCQYYKTQIFTSFPDIFYLMSPVFRASCKDNPEQLSRLIEQGADMNARSRNGLTPLMVASLKGKAAVVKLLVEHGVDVNAQDNNGWTPIAYALDRSTLNAMMARLKYKFRSMSSDQAVFMHYSYLAPTFNNTIAKMLISNGANVNHVYAHDMTPLMSAAFSGNDEIVELLLTKGATADCKDSDGYSPLMCAAMRGYSNIVKLLIEHGADVNSTNNYGISVLTMASGKNDPSTMQLLRDKGATGPISCCSLRNMKVK